MMFSTTALCPFSISREMSQLPTLWISSVSASVASELLSKTVGIISSTICFKKFTACSLESSSPALIWEKTPIIAPTQKTKKLQFKWKHDSHLYLPTCVYERQANSSKLAIFLCTIYSLSIYESYMKDIFVVNKTWLISMLLVWHCTKCFLPFGSSSMTSFKAFRTMLNSKALPKKKQFSQSCLLT